jgi:zinc protease
MTIEAVALKNLPMSFRFIRNFQGIDEYELSNGLKVLLFFDPSEANVTVNITYLVGSRHEGRGEAGMAHLLEHMLFRGTKDLRDVKGALQDRGAQFNATTWYDRTNYFETLTPMAENLEFALKLEADRMVNSLILAEDLAAEMTVVRNEFEMGENNPVHVLHDQVMSSAYLWHNYGKTPIGNRSDIERVPAATLRKFYEYYYQPDNAVLIVAGQFDRQQALFLIDKYFAPLKKPERILADTYTEEPAQDGPREVEVLRVGDMASIAVGYHIPAATHKDHAPIKILFDALVDEPAGPIYQQMVETNKSSEVFAMTYALFEPGMALCFIRPTDDKKVSELRDELISLLEIKAVDCLTKDHVDRIKMRLLKKIKQSISSSKEMALKLSEAIAAGDWRLFFWYRDQIANVSYDDVLRVLKTYLLPSNRTAGVFIPLEAPKRVTIERSPPLDSFINNIVEDASLSLGESFVAHAENIEKLMKRNSFGPHKKTAILAKKTRGQKTRAYVKFRFGDEKTLAPFIKEFWLVPSMLLRGTNKYDYQALRDQIDVLMSSLDIDGHAGSLVASIKSERSYIKDVMALVAHICKEPRFKPEEFMLVRQREIDNYEEIKSDPQRLALHELERLKYPWPKDHILYVHSFDEITASLKELTVKDLKHAYTQVFSLNNFYCSVVGDCDSQELLYLLERELISDQKAAFQRIKRPFIENVATEVKLDTKDKEMAIIAYAFNFPLRDDHEDYPALKLANYMFGENMNSRLMNRIREKEGISYGAGSSLEISRFEENASLSLYAMSAPDSITRARRAIEEEWEKFISEGVLENELKSAQESIWLSFENLLGNDGFLVRALAHDLEVDRDFICRERLYQKMQRLSITDIKASVEKWWGRVKFSKVIAGDLARFG